MLIVSRHVNDPPGQLVGSTHCPKRRRDCKTARHPKSPEVNFIHSTPKVVIEGTRLDKTNFVFLGYNEAHTDKVSAGNR
jgi:hypothetical protein